MLSWVLWDSNISGKAHKLVLRDTVASSNTTLDHYHLQKMCMSLRYVSVPEPATFEAKTLGQHHSSPSLHPPAPTKSGNSITSKRYDGGRIRVKHRRYDVTEIGEPQLFSGWADVQGQGAANDYCRYHALSGITQLYNIPHSR